MCICRGKKVFEPLAKHDLVLGGITLVGKHRRQTCLVVGHQVYTHLRRDLGPLLFADPLQILKVAFSMGGNEVFQYSTLHGPIHSSLDAVETLGRETAPKHNVSTSMLDDGDGVIFSILLPPNAASRVDAKELDFGLICPHPVSKPSLESLKCSLANFRRPCTCASLSKGDLASS